MISALRTSSTVEAGGRKVPVGNLERILYPETSTTKAELLDYYVKVGETALKYLRNRPLSLRRFPEGVASEGFWQKQCPSNHPRWLQTMSVRGSTGTVHHCLANDLPALLWLVSQGTVELHTTLHRRGRKRPDFMLFDLDPGPGCDLLDCVALALDLRERLEFNGVASFAKSSGKKGLHVLVPLKGSTDYDLVRATAERVARSMERAHPERVTATMSKSRRQGKILIDWSQNHPKKTTVCAYSTRAASRPTVSTPVSWGEVEAADDASDPSGLIWDISSLPGRLDTIGDLLDGVTEMRQDLRLLRNGT